MLHRIISSACERTNYVNFGEVTEEQEKQLEYNIEEM